MIFSTRSVINAVRYYRFIGVVVVIGSLFIRCSSDPGDKPNIIIFYVDDLGYGDVGCYGATGVATPAIDSLARFGVRFTDAHCPAATCTPSRYSLLTGRYAFRNRAAILPGDAPLLIDTTATTLPKVFKRAGYNTAVIGKWHLGLGNGRINWNEKISPGASEVGFDYSFLIPATGDRVPTVFVENGFVVNADRNDPIQVNYSGPVEGDSSAGDSNDRLKMTADTQHSNTVVNGVSRIGFMAGGQKARWVDESFPVVFTEKTLKFIDDSKGKPFFLFYSFHDIHVPRMPHQAFVGKSSMGPRGDAIAQLDWTVGQVVKELRKRGLEKNTLIIFTSDNGPVLNDGYDDRAAELVGEHKPAGVFRGGKYSAFEGGTRVPAIVYWPGTIHPHESDALLTQVDLLRSLATLVGEPVTENIDSENQLDAWLGKNAAGREVMIEESFTLALREGNWKYILAHQGDVPAWMANKNIESGLMNGDQLYDLGKDIGEQNNVAGSHPEVVVRMKEKLKEIVGNK
jgi:arylsulfatase A